MRSRKNAVPVPVTRDLLQEKQTEVARLARQASEAVDIVTRTMNELEGINQQIDNDLAEIDTYSTEYFMRNEFVMIKKLFGETPEEQYRYHRQLRKAPGYQSRRERE